MPKRTRLIPPTTIFGVSRGGGSESIEYVSGGPMLLQRGYTKIVPSYGTGTHKGAVVFLPSYMYAIPDPPANLNLTESQVRQQGTSAMNWSRPGYVGSSALTASAELHHEGIPMTPRVDDWKRKAGFLKNISRTHLAVQFGWLPLLAEIQAFARRVTHQNQILQEAYNRSHQDYIHVGYRFPTVTSYPPVTRFTSLTPGDWKSSGLAIGEEVTGAVVFETSVDTWFEGSWQSFIPGYGQDKGEEYLRSTSSKARLLLGPFLSPKMIWELAPWSWAVDWFTNTGSMLDALSNYINDGMVLRNAYVMSHFRNAAHAYYGPGVGYKGLPRSLTPGSVESLVETKRRYPSVPYFGFGSVGELTNRQLSILAALAVAKSRV